MSTENTAPISSPSSIGNTEWLVLDLKQDEGGELPRVMRLSPSAESLVRAVLKATMHNGDARAGGERDPLSNLSIGNLRRIGADPGVRMVVEMLAELEEEDLELLHCVAHALRNGQKGHDMMRAVVRSVCDYVAESEEVDAGSPELSADEGDKRRYYFLKDGA